MWAIEEAKLCTDDDTTTQDDSSNPCNFVKDVPI